jgi:SH3-like domain-containing protein
MLPGRYLVVLWCALISSMPAWGSPTPRIGVVNRDGTMARSGPGQDYYAADALRKGDRLEVYRVDEGGWCAVRPPAGSFSWVLAEHLRMTDTPKVAEVTGDDVLAYVGSRVRKQRDVVQVQLNRGEFVEVVGQDELPSPETGQPETWYRIVPPAGEYRWVHLEFVDRERETASARHRNVAVSGTTNPAAVAVGGPTGHARESSGSTSPRPAPIGDTRTDSVPKHLPASDVVQWKPLPPGTLRERAKQVAAQEAAARVAEEGGIQIVENFVGGEPAPRILGHHDASPMRAASLESPSAELDKASRVIAASAAGSSTSLEDQLAELDIKFSRMVAKPSNQWQLEPLMLRAQQIAESAKTPQVHGKARSLLEKMVQFARLQPGASPLGQVLPPTAMNPTGFPTSAAHIGRAAVPPVAGSAAGSPAYKAGGGLPGLLNAIDSLMPAQPPPKPAITPRPGTSTQSPVASAPPLLQAVSAQTPETAPPPPGDLAWGTSTEPTVRLPHSPTVSGSPVGTGLTEAGSSPWRMARANRPSVAGVPPAAGGGGDGVFERVRDTLLYPFGAGTPDSGAATVNTTVYDGRGWLVPVVSRKGRQFSPSNYMPPFALTDNDGNVLQFVTPAPGVNLHRYVKQEIGIFGQQRPLEHLTEPHVTASRIVMLDRHRR